MPRRERSVFRAVSGLWKTSPGVQDGERFVYVYLFVFVSFALGLSVVYVVTHTGTETLRYNQRAGPVYYRLWHYDSG